MERQLPCGEETMNTGEWLLFNGISDEAKKQHVAAANECVHGTPMLSELNVSSEIWRCGGLEHHLKKDQQ